MKNKTRTYVYVAIYAALAMVFKYVGEFIPFLQMPNGGSIEIELIPIFIASFHLGLKYGIMTGLIWWLLGFILGLNNWYLNIIQYLLDYIIPCVICGTAALFPRINKQSNKFVGITLKMSNVYVGIICTMVLKYLSHVLSGVYYWFPETTYAGSLESWVFSLGYNLWYCLVTMIVCLIVVPILINRLSKNREKFIGVK